MSLTQFIVLVFSTVQVTGVSSWNIPELSDFTQDELLPIAAAFDYEYESKGYTLEEAAKIRILTEEIKTFDIEKAVRICSVLVSSNFTSVEREPIQNSSFDILTLFSLEPLPFNKSEEAQLYKNVLCSYVSHPTEDVKNAEALGISMIPYFKFEHIRKRNNDNQSVEAARQLCDAFYSVDNLANLKVNPIELSESQLVEFENLWNQVEHLDWDKSPKMVVENLCNLLNGKISSNEQAKSLEITVDLYTSVLNGLKELLKDNSIQNRVDIYRQICRDINLSFGYSQLYVSQNGTLTTDDQIKHFSMYTLRVESDGSKWKSIKNVCVYLNETVSIKYISENAGLSEDQLAQYNNYMPGEDDDFLVDNLKSQFLQTINLCNVIKSDNVKDHLCRCPPGFEGNASVQCHPVETYVSPCQPSPCGPNSQCREHLGRAACACLPNYLGSPPSCQPECTINSDCPLTKACTNAKCRDPCISTCGIGAKCEAVNHIPICSCPIQYTGNPFVMCQPIFEQPDQEVINTAVSPCQPSPCGPYSQCREYHGRPDCACLPSHIGSPPSCRPECTVHSDCPLTTACINQKCSDPCIDACGIGAKCAVINHNYICSCPIQYTGDPFVMCQSNVEQPDQEVINRPECTVNSDCPNTKACIRQKCRDPCVGTCGIGAKCVAVNHIPICNCPIQYTGNPFVMCHSIVEQPDQEVINRPECTVNSDCPDNKACIRQKCRDPCVGTCGIGAKCVVVYHNAICSCPIQYTGDPFVMCQSIVEQPDQEVINRPECTVNSDCPNTKACIRQKCRDPCVGTCGIGAKCVAVNHIPICNCPIQYTGNPFVMCQSIVEQPDQEVINPCEPSPCGPNSVCREIGDSPSCSCLQGFIGTPPNCQHECNLNAECPDNLACIDNKCKDPCQLACAQNAECRVVKHIPICACLAGYVGDPFVLCKIQQSPCMPTPCGDNAICTEVHGARSCQCLPDYFGNPYEGCRPECTLNSDCPSSKACIRNKCQNPCEGVCGLNAECQTVNHVPNCACRVGYDGHPFFMCAEQPGQEVINYCEPSPCGPNSVCRRIKDYPVCSCLQEFIGSPPNCRHECNLNAECADNLACIDNKCKDPSKHTCAQNAESRSPSPCGPNSQCSEMNGNVVCSCLSNNWNGMERKLEEFVFKVSKIFSSPVNDRLKLLRGVCLTTFPRLFTIED